ncbi:MAG: NYN domain-containing protein [Acidobacteriia bacterium]|nr:NYN domain-containing protein [Terriglobia bacterium]
MATTPAPLVEPAIKRAVAFIDGQNLYRAVKESFGYHYPNYDVQKLSESVCQARGWNLTQVRFYTGVPDKADDPRWNHFWIGKLAVMGKAGVEVFSRPLRYRNDRVKLPDGTTHTFLRGSEKGIDVRIALDVIRLAVRNEYDVAVVFSQDQDLSEVADEIRIISKLRGRWIRIACAYPISPTTKNKRGINHSDWVQIDRQTYDTCIDPTDYR